MKKEREGIEYMSNIILMSLGLEDKVLFRASRTNRDGVQSQDNPKASYALGLLYLHSYLESKGHIVRTFLMNEDSFVISRDKISHSILENMPDYIGIQILTQTRVNAFKMIEYLHDNYPNIKIIVGGIHATIMYDQIIRKYPFVIIIIGEGEITFSEIVDLISLPAGIAYWDGINVVKTPDRKLIDNLDVLPFPYHAKAINNKKTSASIISSRGCYSSCSFCCLNPNAKKMIRFRTAKNVVDEIEYIATQFPQITTIDFMDDSFTADNNRVIELCKEIIARKLNKFNYTCVARFKPFHEKMIPYMERAGFRIINFGLESGNEEILTRCHKNLKQKDIMNTLTKLKHSIIQYNVY
ncbi:MAG: cobalamin-dependent protein, partial [Candidatus Subteraquimicrobiales bacterium]|nr:cobalamin-dependent protein [Candidatus Subteraquimicrobiales bacterium]